MKKILIKSFFFLLLIAASTLPLLKFISKDFADKFYYKFTYKAQSLILGSSRTLLSIDPESVNKKKWITSPLLNYGFTQATSPYGEIYYKAICKKLLDSGKQGCFILEVNPIGMSTDTKKSKLPEEGLILDRLLLFNINPNIDYILENTQAPLYLFFFNDKKKAGEKEHFHKSGWVENIAVTDSIKKSKKIASQTREYQKVFDTYTLSDYRKNWFEKTIDELSLFGKVIVIRVPITPKMKNMENIYYPDFNKMIFSIALKHSVPYLDFSEITGYNFNDLHHMSSESAIKFSEFLGDTLQKIDVTLSK